MFSFLNSKAILKLVVITHYVLLNSLKSSDLKEHFHGVLSKTKVYFVT